MPSRGPIAAHNPVAIEPSRLPSTIAVMLPASPSPSAPPVEPTKMPAR